MNYAVQGNTLRFRSGVITEFSFTIKEAIAAGNVIIVVLEVPSGEFMTENVFGVTQNGEIAWQIERIPETSTDKGNFYVGITSSEPDCVRLVNWNDMTVEANVKTGRILSKRQGRFT